MPTNYEQRLAEINARKAATLERVKENAEEVYKVLDEMDTLCAVLSVCNEGEPWTPETRRTMGEAWAKLQITLAKVKGPDSVYAQAVSACEQPVKSVRRGWRSEYTFSRNSAHLHIFQHDGTGSENWATIHRNGDQAKQEAIGDAICQALNRTDL